MANTLPRPRPPGRTRPQRSSPLTSFEPNEANPPPPYVDGQDSFTGNLREDLDLSNIVHSSLEDKSKEELASLLLQASSTISAKQNDLTMAASIGQELVQINKDLQDALHARRSPVTTPTRLSEPSPDFRRMAQPSLSSDNKIQEAISLLQSQNEMLMTQIRHLEEDSFESQKQGKKRIMLLEKEMSLMRSGLELSQQRAHELEVQLEEDRRREVRRTVHHKRLNALRQRLARPDNHFRNSRDFALGAEPESESQCDSQYPPLSPDTSSDSLPDPAYSPSASLKNLPSSYTNRQTAPPLDENISNKLLLKISELETANKELIASQLDIKSRLEHLSLSNASNVDFPLGDSPIDTFFPASSGHSRSSSANHSGSLPHLRRSRVESQGSAQLRLNGLSAPPTPFFPDFPQSQSKAEAKQSLLEEISRVQDDISAYASESPEQSFLERSDYYHPTLPGAFESPVKSPTDIADRFCRRRAQSLVDLRAQSPEVDADDAGDGVPQTVQLSHSSSFFNTNTTQRSSLFVQLWVFLQFCVVVVVLMFSMGRRIPPQRLR